MVESALAAFSVPVLPSLPPLTLLQPWLLLLLLPAPLVATLMLLQPWAPVASLMLLNATLTKPTLSLPSPTMAHPEHTTLAEPMDSAELAGSMNEDGVAISMDSWVIVSQAECASERPWSPRFQRARSQMTP